MERELLFGDRAAFRRWLEENGRTSEGVWPVSYTHLDVYKRQLPFPLAFFCIVTNIAQFTPAEKGGQALFLLYKLEYIDII